MLINFMSFKLSPRDRLLTTRYQPQHFLSHLSIIVYTCVQILRYSAAERIALAAIKSQLYLRDAVLAFKCMTGSAPTYLSSMFLTRGKVSGRTTRSSQLLQIPLFKSRSGQRTFFIA